MERPAEQRAQMIITLDANGGIGVSGPLHNKLLAYGMLQVAMETVSNFKEEDASRLVRPFGGAPVGLDLGTLKAGGDDRP